MTSMRVTVNMKTDVLNKRIAGVDKRARGAITGVMKYYTGVLTKEMRQNAPWQDRTGNARSGLHASLVKPNENVWQIILAHSVPYGVYLETRWSGKYAIIRPTMDEWKWVIQDRCNQMVANARGAPDTMVWEFGDE